MFWDTQLPHGYTFNYKPESPSWIMFVRELEKNGRSDGFGVDKIDKVSKSGPESLKFSSSSKRSSISAGSMSPPTAIINCNIKYKKQMIILYFLYILYKYLIAFDL